MLSGELLEECGFLTNAEIKEMWKETLEEIRELYPIFLEETRESTQEMEAFLKEMAEEKRGGSA